MEKRLDKVAQRLRGQDDHGPILWVDVTRWTIPDQDAFRDGTPEQQEDLIERHCGRRPAVTGPDGPVRTVIDLPPRSVLPCPERPD